LFWRYDASWLVRTLRSKNHVVHAIPNDLQRPSGHCIRTYNRQRTRTNLAQFRYVVEHDYSVERLPWIGKYHPRHNSGRSTARSGRNDLPEIQSTISLRHLSNSTRQHLHRRRLHPRRNTGCPGRNTPDTVTRLELPRNLLSPSFSF